MSSQKSLAQRWSRLLVVALLCALPFLIAAYYLQAHARKIDTLPLDDYSGLRWMPGHRELGFLHLPLRQNPPAETEIWKVDSAGLQFGRVGEVAAGKDWTLTKMHSGPWVLLESAQGERVMCNGARKVQTVEVAAEYKLMNSQGDGLFYQVLEEDLPFDQFVDVEAAPDMKPELDEQVSSSPQDDPWSREEETEAAPKPPTHFGLKVAEYLPDEDRLEPLFSIPYNNPSDEPLVHLIRRSPDKRFFALVVQFGESGSPGLWIYDSENERLLWTRVVVQNRAYGMDWSSDSVTVAVSDERGLAILEKALGIESTRLEMATTPDLKPMFGAGKKLFLVSSLAVYRVESERGVAEPVFDSKGAQDLVLDPLGGRVAYSISPKGFRELVVRDLKTNQNLARVAYPGSLKQKAQGTILYQIGSAIRLSWEMLF